MKKTFGNLKDNFLSQVQMKMITGGVLPGDDDGGDDGEGYRTYKCCHKFDHQNCSTCKKGVCQSAYDRLPC
jgi:hypothetical protein